MLTLSLLSTLFPYTTLFRSVEDFEQKRDAALGVPGVRDVEFPPEPRLVARVVGAGLLDVLFVRVVSKGQAVHGTVAEFPVELGVGVSRHGNRLFERPVRG